MIDHRMALILSVAINFISQISCALIKKISWQWKQKIGNGGLSWTPSKHDQLTQCSINAGQTSATVDYH